MIDCELPASPHLAAVRRGHVHHHGALARELVGAHVSEGRAPRADVLRARIVVAGVPFDVRLGRGVSVRGVYAGRARQQVIVPTDPRVVRRICRGALVVPEARIYEERVGVDVPIAGVAAADAAARDRALNVVNHGDLREPGGEVAPDHTVGGCEGGRVGDVHRAAAPVPVDSVAGQRAVPESR
jgi:hypothetical protein